MQARSVEPGNPATRLTSVTALAEASELCKQRHVQLTARRKALLEILWEHPHRPQGAYPLMRRLESLTGRQVTATSVYRALEFLLRERLAMRVESRNAYLPCPHTRTLSVGAFFLCDLCGTAMVVNDPAIERVLAKRARSIGFRVLRRVIEFHGLCDRCAKTG
jgi:Fur family zinc uptake transcriptional regulator